MEFTASFDTTAKTVTTVVCVFFFALCVWNVMSIKRAKGDKMNVAVRVAISLLLVFAVWMAFRYSTEGYGTYGKTLVIKTHDKDIAFTYMQIMDVRRVSEDEMKGLSRSFGFGGLFGYYGHYHNATIGDMTFYATQQKNWVLIHTSDNKALILTPDDPDKLVSEVKAIITPNN